MVEGFKMEENLMDDLVQTVHALRMLSLNVIDRLVRWREQILFAYSIVKEEKTIHFRWNDENYIEKMKVDTLWMNQSHLSKYFNFSTKCDPFLVLPSTQGVSSLRKNSKEEK